MKIKSFTSKVLCGTAAAVFAFAVISFSCSKVKVEGSADTVYADTAAAENKPAISISPESLKVIEALQNSFNAISSLAFLLLIVVDTK